MGVTSDNANGVQSEQDVLAGEQGCVRVLTLNRPRVLNSLNLSVVSRLAELFEQWEKDDSVSLIIIKAAGAVFCAGGDLRMFYSAGKKDESWKQVVYKKYWLDYHLYSYKKPRIALWHGLVVGGGAGFTFPSTFRIVTEKAAFSTPEVAVGFHADCSASYYLPRLQGHLGEYLALTGTRLDYAEMVACGLATHFIPSQDVPEVETRLLSLQAGDVASLREVIETFSKPVTVQEDSVLNRIDVINKCFSKARMEDVIESLVEESSRCSDKWIEKTVQLLKRLSPVALKQTLASVRQGRHGNLKDCLDREYRMTLNCLRGLASDDLYEGIRAVVVDKDHAPKWKPALLGEVSDAMVDHVLKTYNQQEQLQLPLPEAERWTGKYEQVFS